jgi:cytochrome P450
MRPLISWATRYPQVPLFLRKHGKAAAEFEAIGRCVTHLFFRSMHRDASIFPSPDTFLPDRWLETAGNKEELARMNQYMMPFGVGSRVCGGQNLAQVMLRIAVATVVKNFDIVAPPETNESTMEMRDSFVCRFYCCGPLQY